MFAAVALREILPGTDVACFAGDAKPKRRRTNRCTRFSSTSAAMSSAVYADFIDDFLTVRYEGTVTSVRDTNANRIGSVRGYEVGDHVSGELLIDLRRAGPDRVPSNPALAIYGSPFGTWPSEGNSFVSGYVSTRERTADRVDIRDNYEGADLFAARDAEVDVFKQSDGRRREYFLFFLQASSRVVDFVHGDGIVQQFVFDSTMLGDTVQGSGEIEIRRGWVDSVVSAIGGSVRFVLTRFSVKPGRCSM